MSDRSLAGQHAKNEWYTPRWLVGPGSLLGVFDLDPCAPSRSHGIAHTSLSANEGDDGLTAEWSPTDCVFLNPPFSGRAVMQTWIRKMVQHAERGGSGILLVPAAVDTDAIQMATEACLAVLFFDKRLQFIPGSGQKPSSARDPYALFAFGAEGLRRLVRAHAIAVHDAGKDERPMRGTLLRPYGLREAIRDAFGEGPEPVWRTEPQPEDPTEAILATMPADERTEFEAWYRAAHEGIEQARQTELSAGIAKMAAPSDKQGKAIPKRAAEGTEKKETAEHPTKGSGNVALDSHAKV